MDNIFINHLKDLSTKSERTGRYMFTDFLSLDEQSELKAHIGENCKLFGGAENCERVVARFGDADSFGYEEDFPITCLHFSPVLKKFADALSHRDFLGALMNLGIERKNIGDIIVRENEAYIFVLDRMADYISENLTKVKHTVIKCEAVPELPDGTLYKTEESSVNVSSLRLDCMIAAVYDFSRSKCSELFVDERVFINGKLCKNPSHIPNENDIISVRKCGRFIFLLQGGTTKKGRLYIKISKFI